MGSTLLHVHRFNIARRLLYLTRYPSMFQAFDRQGQLRAICGGGRYDRLLSSFGGVDTPACGFGFGDAVIVEVCRHQMPKATTIALEIHLWPCVLGKL